LCAANPRRAAPFSGRKLVFQAFVAKTCVRKKNLGQWGGGPPLTNTLRGGKLRKKPHFTELLSGAAAMLFGAEGVAARKMVEEGVCPRRPDRKKNPQRGGTRIGLILSESSTGGFRTVGGGKHPTDPFSPALELFFAASKIHPEPAATVYLSSSPLAPRIALGKGVLDTRGLVSGSVLRAARGNSGLGRKEQKIAPGEKKKTGEPARGAISNRGRIRRGRFFSDAKAPGAGPREWP